MESSKFDKVNVQAYLLPGTFQVYAGLKHYEQILYHLRHWGSPSQKPSQLFIKGREHGRAERLTVRTQVTDGDGLN